MSDTDTDWVWAINFEPDDSECIHKYEPDWYFGAATGDDPRADPRWMPATYLFIDRTFQTRHQTSEPRCDHEARGSYRQRLDARMPKEYETFFIMVVRPGSDKGESIFARFEEVMSAAGQG